jgi:hypothetical protein
MRLTVNRGSGTGGEPLMTRRETPWLVAVASVIAIGIATPTEAGPIVISGGTVAIVNGIDLPAFALTGPGTELHGILPIGGTICCVLNAGDLATLDRTFPLSTLPGQPNAEMVNGTSYPLAYITGTLAFTTVPFTVPSSSGGFAFSTPFTATGQLSGFADAARSIPLFTVDLIGSGTATAGGRTLPDATFLGESLSFTFAPETQSPSPTPEPASALLFATGMAGLAVSRRLRTRRRQIAKLSTGFPQRLSAGVRMRQGHAT